LKRPIPHQDQWPQLRVGELQADRCRHEQPSSVCDSNLRVRVAPTQLIFRLSGVLVA
jgi:hypothetical protein